MRKQSIESSMAYEKAKERIPSIREQIHSFVRSRGGYGVIAEDVLSQFPLLRYSTVTARLSELRRDGALVKTGVRNTSYSGSPAAVLVDADYQLLKGTTHQDIVLQGQGPQATTTHSQATA